jgi:ferredoxin-NADP reductase
MTPLEAPHGSRAHTSCIIHRQWLTDDTFTLDMERPPGFQFHAGQRIQLITGGKTRDYSLIPGDPPTRLTLLIRSVAGGVISTHLSRCPMGTALDFTGPAGHFIYRPSERPAIFIATGTGVAPFAAMCRTGVTGFVMLHGVADAGDLYFRELLEPAADRYIPCLTVEPPPLPSGAYRGRVTQYLQDQLPAGPYDFYLAGRREMIADVIAIVDHQFPSSRVYSEIFF